MSRQLMKHVATDLGKNIYIFTEIYMTAPGQLVLLLAKSEVAFYTATCLSLAAEVGEAAMLVGLAQVLASELPPAATALRDNLKQFVNGGKVSPAKARGLSLAEGEALEQLVKLEAMRSWVGGMLVGMMTGEKVSIICASVFALALAVPLRRIAVVLAFKSVADLLKQNYCAVHRVRICCRSIELGWQTLALLASIVFTTLFFLLSGVSFGIYIYQ